MYTDHIDPRCKSAIDVKFISMRRLTKESDVDFVDNEKHHAIPMVLVLNTWCDLKNVFSTKWSLMFGKKELLDVLRIPVIVSKDYCDQEMRGYMACKRTVNDCYYSFISDNTTEGHQKFTAKTLSKSGYNRIAMDGRSWI